jgi:hypothetical protein
MVVAARGTFVSPLDSSRSHHAQKEEPPCVRNDDFVDAVTANCHARVALRSALPEYASTAVKDYL